MLAYQTCHCDLGGQGSDFLKEMYSESVFHRKKVPRKMKASLLTSVLFLLRMNVCLELVWEEHPSKVCLMLWEGLPRVYQLHRKDLSTLCYLDFIYFTEIYKL